LWHTQASGRDTWRAWEKSLSACIHVYYVCVRSTYVYLYAGVQVKAWTNLFVFLLTYLFFRKKKARQKCERNTVTSSAAGFWQIDIDPSERECVTEKLLLLHNRTD